MKVIIEIIPHERQRIAGQIGDWTFLSSSESVSQARRIPIEELVIRVSNLGDYKKEMAVAFHELFEALVCKATGVAEKSVDDFDRTWKNVEGITNYEEAGDDARAPYHQAHVLAGIAERLLANAMGLDWTEYAEAVDALTETK